MILLLSNVSVPLWFAAVLITVFLFGIGFITYLLYKTKPDDPDTIKGIFSALLPLFASWIGTIIAFYFGAQQINAANEQTRNAMVATEKLTTELRLITEQNKSIIHGLEKRLNESQPPATSE